MREIKFRAWQKCNRPQMIYWEGLVVGHGEPFISKAFEDEDMDFMQFTGLKDKNGKEAYHKDIVEYDDEKWIMEWNENSACFELLSIDGSEVIGMDYSMKFEIIGNIYEHPELLKRHC